MPIHISEALLMGVAGDDVPTLEQQLWLGSGGTCALCSEAIDREGDELEAGRDGAGGLRLSHARCHHDVVSDGDRVRLESELADNPAGYLKRRGWRKSRAKRVDPRVPLLRAGSERRWTWIVEGALADGSGVQLGCLAISFGGEGGEDHEGVFIEGDGEDLWTVVVLDADYPDIGFVTLTEHARELDWVADDSTRQRVALESATFERTVRLTLAVDGDELEVRERFTPAVQLALASRRIPFGDRYEADRGTVIVAREGNRSLDDLPELIDLLGDALWLRAVVAEDPPGRVPEREALRALVLEDEAER